MISDGNTCTHQICVSAGKGVGRAYNCVKLSKAEGGKAADLQAHSAWRGMGAGGGAEATGVSLVKEGSGKLHVL